MNNDTTARNYSITTTIDGSSELSINGDINSYFDLFGYITNEYDSENTKEESRNKKMFNNYVSYKKGGIYSKDSYDYVQRYIMPDIKDVKVINNKIIILTFMDDTTEKAILNDGDSFSLEEGITICVLKKILSDKSRSNGTAVYNKIIRHAMKIYTNKVKHEEEEKKKRLEEKRKEEKFINKKKVRDAKKRAAEREEKVSIIKDALLEYEKCSIGQNLFDDLTNALFGKKEEQDD